MAHKTLIGGTAYEITGGNDLIGGTAYSKAKGRTLVGGTGYDINFKKPVSISYTGKYNLYGDGEKGWIEMLSDGTLTIDGGDIFDIYLLGSGKDGVGGAIYGDGGSLYKGTAVSDPTPHHNYGGQGGNGGRASENYGVVLSGSYDVGIGLASIVTLGTYKSTAGDKVIPGGYGGIGAISVNQTSYGGNPNDRAATAGGNGTRPFANRTPLNQGMACYALGAGGGGGGVVAVAEHGGGAGGTYGGGAGATPEYYSGHYGGAAKKNTGSGGGGGGANWPYSQVGSGGSGGSGIAIVRWGY